MAVKGNFKWSFRFAIKYIHIKWVQHLHAGPFKNQMQLELQLASHIHQQPSTMAWDSRLGQDIAIKGNEIIWM